MVDCLGFLLKVIVGEGNASERTLAQAAVMELVEAKPEPCEQVELMWVGDLVESVALLD